MHFKINSIEVQRTDKTKDREPIYNATVTLSCPTGTFQAIFLFTYTGVFLLKHGKPFVRFHDFDRSAKRKYGQGTTNYQSLLYNRIIEKLDLIKIEVTSYLIKNEFIDPLSLLKLNPTLYRAANQIENLYASHQKTHWLKPMG